MPKHPTSVGIDRKYAGELRNQAATKRGLLLALLFLRDLHARRWRRCSCSRCRRPSGTLQEQECVLVQCVEILSDGRRGAHERNGQRDGCKKCDFAHVYPQSKHRDCPGMHQLMHKGRLLKRASGGPGRPNQTRTEGRPKHDRRLVLRLNWPLKPPP